jgi:DNA polymerase III epsilon subunit-like protein
MTKDNNPRGYFEKILAVDCETTGLFLDDGRNNDPSRNALTGEYYQAIAWGIVVADFATLQPIEKLYLEIQYDPNARWDTGAEKIHGLSKQHLAENGLTEAEAVEEIASLIIKYWGTDTQVHLLGHNVATFDLFFLRQLLRKFDIQISFGSRHLDTNSISWCTFGTFNSDDFFAAIGLEERGKHNALEDALMSLEAARRVRTLFQKIII